MNPSVLGQAGEELAAYWLGCLNYQILEFNSRFQQGEIDLVCQDGQELVFVEVRLRSNRCLEIPAESVTPAKQHRLYLAAAAYLAKTDSWRRPFRFDLVEITLAPTQIRVGLLTNFLAAEEGW